MAYNEFANIYDELIYEDIDYDEISEKIISLSNENNIEFEDYLDLACGTGNVGVRVGKYFKNMYAVDLSNDMLNIAFEKFKQNKIKAKVICQDMSELSLNHKFNLITSVLDSTNYITEEEDLFNYFKSVYDHLKDDGLFIFDINSYYKLSEIMGNNIYTYSSEDVFYTWENTFEDNILNMFLTFFVKNENNLYERFEEEHFEKAYQEKDIEDILNEIGFNQNMPFEIAMQESTYSNTDKIETEIQLADSGYGQGQILVNPLHLASIYTSFLNEGNMIKPYLKYKEEASGETWIENAFSKENVEEIMQGVEGVVNDPEGTGYAAHRDDILLAGKTGTAELKATKEDTSGKEIGWFSVFTADKSVDKPILLISMVENVKGIGGSGYVVKKDATVLEEYFEK